nr:activating signal cointegrator 1 complex subunit 3-like [Cherax quadricarinatus]
MNAEIVAGTISSKQEALDYLTWTYFFRRLVQNPSYYGLDLDEDEKPEKAINSLLSSTIDRALGCLEAAYCIEVSDDNRTVQTTPLGRIASFYYLSHKTIHQFQEKLNPSLTVEDFLDLLTQAYEYDQLPVRHNEDNLNGELAKSCPIEVNAYTYDSSHTKAHLLLQATNPSYYGLDLDEDEKPEKAINSLLSSTIDRALGCLEAAYCIEVSVVCYSFRKAGESNASPEEGTSDLVLYLTPITLTGNMVT